MVQRKQVRHLFFGSNTSRGFTSYFQETTTSPKWYTFVLKGGPGTGKSTFMQRTATDLLPLGAEIEYHYCSADPDSIDAITIPAIGVAIVDGTAPHIIEPVHYGVTGEI